MPIPGRHGTAVTRPVCPVRWPAGAAAGAGITQCVRSLVVPRSGCGPGRGVCAMQADEGRAAALTAVGLLVQLREQDVFQCGAVGQQVGPGSPPSRWRGCRSPRRRCAPSGLTSAARRRPRTAHRSAPATPARPTPGAAGRAAPRPRRSPRPHSRAATARTLHPQPAPTRRRRSAAQVLAIQQHGVRGRRPEVPRRVPAVVVAERCEGVLQLGHVRPALARHQVPPSQDLPRSTNSGCPSSSASCSPLRIVPPGRDLQPRGIHRPPEARADRY
jgi:hypothetical protein